MTYIDLLNSFTNWLEGNYMSPSAQLLLFRLAGLWNQCGRPVSFHADNLRLMSMIDVKARTSLERARKELVQAGFLAYTPGKKGRPGLYSLCVPLSAPLNDAQSKPMSDTQSEPHNRVRDRDRVRDTPQTFPASQKKFLPPSVAEVDAYVREKGYHIDPEAFVAFYESKGWKVGANPMKDWKAAVVTWEKRTQEPKSANEKQEPHPLDLGDLDMFLREESPPEVREL